MLNKLGTTEDMIEYHPNGNKSYEFKTYSDGFIQEATRDKNGYPLTYKNSRGYYEVKEKEVTQQEYEAFINELEKKQIKQQMKKYIINCILVMALFYLLIAFVTLEIDFRLWDAFTRGMLGFFGTLLAMCISATIIAIKNNK